MEASLAQVHAGAVDVLVGTQMIAKGHDFRRVTLVAAINPDAALFSSDFRAPERLFALLMQSAGRAGRDAAQSAASEMWVQTQHAQHPLFAALKAHDYPGFAAAQLAERAQAGLPPFTHLALLRADARSQDAAQGFLAAFAQMAQQRLAADPALADALAPISWYPAVPLPVQRVAGIERAQMLLESPARGALQRVLAAGQPLLHALRANLLKGSELAHAQFDTIRLRLLKIGARMQAGRTFLRFHFPTSCPTQDILMRASSILAALNTT